LHDSVKIWPKGEELGGNRPAHRDPARMGLAPPAFELEAVPLIVEGFPRLLCSGVEEAVEDFVRNARTPVREALERVERGKRLELLRCGLYVHGKGSVAQERHTASQSPLM
jgi:hypothetical protein